MAETWWKGAICTEVRMSSKDKRLHDDVRVTVYRAEETKLRRAIIEAAKRFAHADPSDGGRMTAGGEIDEAVDAYEEWQQAEKARKGG